MNWINVKDSLPEIFPDVMDEGSDFVLGWTDLNDERINLVRYRYDWKKFVDVNNNEVSMITH